MEKKDYFERILIKLQRQYGKDELVASLLKQIGEKDEKIGKLNAEIDHLHDRIKSEMGQKEANIQAKTEARKEELYRMQNKENQILRYKIEELSKIKNDLLIRNYALLKQLNS